MKIAFFEVNGKQHGTLFFDRAHRHVAYEDAASFYAGMNTTTSLKFQKQPAKLKPTEQGRV